MGILKKTPESVYLIAGKPSDKAFVKNFLINKKDNELIFAVDSGLEALDSINIVPDIILGDFDSVGKEILKKYIDKKDIRIIRHNPIKDASDTELAVDECIKARIRKIYMLNCLGGRMDHTFANIYLAYKCIKNDVDVYIFDEFNKIYFRKSSFELNRSNLYGKYIAFFSTYRPVSNFYITGFKYPLRTKVLDSWLNPSLTISNELIEPSGYISFEDGAVMVIESRDKKPDWSNNK